MYNEQYGIKRKAAYDALKHNYEKHNIVYLHAPIGWGKMLLIEELIDKEDIKPVLQIDWSEHFSVESFELERKKIKPKCVVIYGFEKAEGHRELQSFVEYLEKEEKTCKFMIGASMDIPREMRILSAKNIFTVMRLNDFMPDKDDVKIFLKEEGVPVNEYELACIRRDLFNMPLCLTLLVSRLQEAHGRYSKYVSGKCEQDVFLYLESTLFQSLPLKYQNYLLKLSSFDIVNLRLVQEILEITEKEGKDFLLSIHRHGSILSLRNYDGEYGFYPLMHHFLKNRVVQFISLGERKAIYKKALSYYSNRQNFVKALVYADMLEDVEQIARLIELLIVQKGNDVDYFLMEQYINQLPQDTIMARPKLMLAKAMICAMVGEKKEADYWYYKLEKKVEESVGLAEHEEVFQCMNALDIVMPGQNTSKRLKKLIYLENQMSYGADHNENYISVTFTSNLPSVLHGTKDFCKYAPKYKEIFDSIHEAFTKIFGKKGITLLYIAAGETLYEQNQLGKALIPIEKAVRETKLEKDAALHFSATVTRCKLLLAEGNQDTIHSVIGEIENTVNMYESISLYENMQAFIAEVDLIQGNEEKILAWLNELAPKDSDRFCVFLYYQYMIKIKVLLLQKKYNRVHSIIEQIVEFVKDYDLLYLKIQLHILEAIAYFREENNEYISHIKRAVDLGRKIEFIRVFADEGAAIYPILMEYGKIIDKNDTYYQQLLKATLEYKNRYPNYLGTVEENEVLTNTEFEVLKYLAKGIKNSEIAKAMFVSENTVKYHLKNIYMKLEVTSRSQAVKVAMDRNML